MKSYVLHGYRIDSEFDLSQSRDRGEFDTVITVRRGGVRAVPTTIAAGRMLQALAHKQTGMLYSTVVLADQTILLRVHGHVDFEIDCVRRNVVAWVDPESSDEMVAILLSGLLVSVLLVLEGELVLHASAVESDGDIVAFVAHSGMGKSTLAALFCARGWRFVTDDVLRVRLDDAGKHACWLGATENRLRRDAASLFGDDADRIVTRTSTDGRTVWSPPESSAQLGRLRAIIIPQPDRSVTVPTVRVVDPARAIIDLTRLPRVQGWQDAVGRAEMFRNLGRLTASVPVLCAVIPWGPPFSPSLSEALLTEIDGASSNAQR